MNTPRTAQALSEPEVNCRILLLGALKDALTDLGVQAVIARHHRLVLTSAREDWAQHALTEPKLHVFTTGGTRKVVTDQMMFRFEDGDEYPVSDPAATATAICGQHAPVTA